MPTKTLPIVYKTRQMFDVETNRGGRDVRHILIDLYNTLGSQAAVAKELGVSQPTIQNWFEMLGIEIVSKTEAVLVMGLTDKVAA